MMKKNEENKELQRIKDTYRWQLEVHYMGRDQSSGKWSPGDKCAVIMADFIIGHEESTYTFLGIFFPRTNNYWGWFFLIGLGHLYLSADAVIEWHSHVSAVRVTNTFRLLPVVQLRADVLVRGCYLKQSASAAQGGLSSAKWFW